MELLFLYLNNKLIVIAVCVNSEISYLTCGDRRKADFKNSSIGPSMHMSAFGSVVYTPSKFSHGFALHYDSHRYLTYIFPKTIVLAF